MTLTQYNTATSLDGFIADENNSLEWLFSVETPSGTSEDRFAPFMANVGAWPQADPLGESGHGGGWSLAGRY